MVYVDDCHGEGVLGETGAGIVDHFGLQGSIDFEKDLGVAKSLFQIYEYTRVALIEEFKSCKIDRSLKAVNALSEIRESWSSVD